MVPFRIAMSDLAKAKIDNRNFDLLAHRNVEYKVGGIKFEILYFSVVNHSSTVSRGKKHSHTMLELSLIEEGEIGYETKELQIPVKQGEVFFMPPGKIHSWRPLKLPYTITGFQFRVATESDDPKFMEYFRERAEEHGYTLREFPAFAEALAGIRREFRDQSPYYMDRIDCLIRELLIGFMRKVSLHLEEDSEKHQHREPNVQRAWVMKDYIHANLSLPLTLDDLADHMNLGIRQLNRIFKEQQGVSLGSYIIATKIEAAADELKTTQHDIAQVARHTGFSDADYFCRLFKQKKGLSPSAYRKKHAPEP